MRKTESTTIRGRTFKVTQLPGMAGVRLFYRLSSAVIPAFAKLGNGLEKLNGMDTDLRDLAGIGDAAQLLFEKLPEQEFEKLMRELLTTTTVKPLDGSPEQPLLPIFDEEMAGETPAVLQLTAFALKVNYGNFMPGLVASARALQATKAAQSPSKASTT